MPAQLGDFPYATYRFPQMESVIASYHEQAFTDLPPRKRFGLVNANLLRLIEEAPKESFLLPAVLLYISKVHDSSVLDQPYLFRHFEFWLDNFSRLDAEANANVRGQIAGKGVPREAYQLFFPIGGGKVYEGGHFVAAHASPDIDTAVASFWGWMDAFAACVSEGQHHWSLPSEQPASAIQRIFQQLIEADLFSILAHRSGTLTLNALDLMTPGAMRKERSETLSTQIDYGDRQAVVLVDDEGHFLGDWRSVDVEPVRQILMSFKVCFRWFENNFHHHLISLFAKPHLTTQDLLPFFDTVFNVSIDNCEPAQEFTEKQASCLDEFFRKILGVLKGTKGTFGELIEVFGSLGLSEIAAFRKRLDALANSSLFDAKGALQGDRTAIFKALESIIKELDSAIIQIHNYVDQLGVVIRIKHDVLGHKRNYVTIHSDVEELRIRIKDYDHLTVVIPMPGGKFFPLGTVTAQTLKKKALGTVTQRDFCNLQESQVASYLEVISVVDHHKTALNTSSVPMAIIGDAQSSNVLIAEQTFRINDRYGLGGMRPEQISEHIHELQKEALTASEMRCLQRLLQRRIVAQQPGDYYINPMREYAEYSSFLLAILDDTDLLSKVTQRDVLCVASLLNRMKSLMLGREVEIIDFDDLAQGASFPKEAAKRILQNADMYSIYKKIYTFREQEVEDNLASCVQGNPSNIFDDTKEQNGCCRVGQTKIFASSYSGFLEKREAIRQHWLDQAMQVHATHSHFDLHIHMISTISSADEVFEGSKGSYPHRDEMWIWVAPTQRGYDHLAGFLSALQLPKIPDLDFSLELPSTGTGQLRQVFRRNFRRACLDASETDVSLPIAVLHYKAGSLNSRKSQVSPFLPHLVV